MKPYFSVIIPTLNEEQFLKYLLTDFVKQNCTDFEVIVVDAFSSDKTKQVALQFEKCYPLRFITALKKNVSHQRNLGASVANGEYLFFVDADSRISRSFLKKTRQFIQKHKGFLFIPSIIPGENNPQSVIAFQIANMIIGISQYTNKPMSSGGAMIVEKELFSKIGGFSETVYMAEDHLLVSTAHSWGVSARFMEKITIRFSLRRMKEEGQLRVLYKTLLATAHLMWNGKIEKKIVEYEMGGQRYGKKNKQNTLEKVLRYPLDQVTEIFKNLLK